MPWIHLHVSQQGKTNACCISQINYGNINDQGLKEIWEGEKIKAVRKSFLSGAPDKRCFNCIQREAAGAKSLRQETFEKFPDVEVKNEKAPLPIYFDIRFSNVCNFRCRTCWHGASSRWFQDAKLLGTHVAEKAVITNVDDFDSFISKFGEALLHAEEFYFAGGEPLVTEQHYLLLEWLIEHGATGARLRYNTNFSKLTYKDRDVLDLWSHFTFVEVMASIDASEELGEYIRKEFDWKVFLQNRDLIRSQKHIQFKLSPTVSILNVLHLPDLYQQALDLQLITKAEWYLNILEFPGHYNIQILPETLKEVVRSRYHMFIAWARENKMPQTIIHSFEDILNYMDQVSANSTKNQAHLWQRFLEQTDHLNEIRSETSIEIKEFLSRV
jgi:sulfatase maturation enzyme AslB (radical SAM superfamily)